MYPQKELSYEVVNSTTNSSSSIYITDKVNQNNEFIEEEILKDLQNHEEPTNDCLGTLDCNAKFDKVTYKTTNKLKRDKSDIVQNELSHSSISKQCNNDVEIIASVAGTDSKKKVNSTESQYVNLKEINQSPYYYQVTQDKMMLNSRLASMKRGTVFDLVDKNSRFKAQQVYKPHIKPKSKHVLVKPQEIHMISGSEQCHKSASKSIHELAGTQNPPTDIHGRSIQVANLVDSKMYENLKNVVKILGLNADSNQMTDSQFIKSEYEPELENNRPPLSKDPIPPLSNNFVPPLPKLPLPPLPKQPLPASLEQFLPPLPEQHLPPLPNQPLRPLPQEPTTQNVQFSCKVTLPSSTSALIPNWHLNSYQQYQSVPGPVPYQPMDCCGIKSQNSLLPSPFPTHSVTPNSYIAVHSTPVVYNRKPNSSHCNHIVTPHSEPRCSSCYHSYYNCNPNSYSQVLDVPSNSTQTKITNIKSEQNNNPFHTGRYASKNSGQFYNNYNNVKQNTNFYQRYKNEYPRYPKHSQKCDERRPRNDRWDKYHEREQTDDDRFFGTKRQSVRGKYSYPVNKLRNQYVNETIFDRSKSYTDFNSEKSHRGCREEVKTFRNIENKDEIRRDQSKYFNVNKINRGRNECFNRNDKESYISPLENLYESSKDCSFQSVSNQQHISKQLQNKQVKEELKNTSLKVHNNESNNETLVNCKKISRPDKNFSITEDKILENNKHPQNTLTKKSESLNQTKKYGFLNKNSQQSNKPHITETSSTVFDAESKLYNTALTKHIPKLSKAQTNIQNSLGAMVVKNNQNNVGEPINIKPYDAKRKRYDKQTTYKQKSDSSNNSGKRSISSAEQDSNKFNSDAKRIKYDEAVVVPKKSNEMVKVCHKIQPNSVSNTLSLQFEDDHSSGNSTTVSEHLLFKNTSSLKSSSETSEVTKKKYIRKRIKVIYSDSDNNSEIEEIKQSIPGSNEENRREHVEENRLANSTGVTRNKYVKKHVKNIGSDSDCNSKIEETKQSNLGSDVQKENNGYSKNTSGVSRKKSVCSDSDSSSVVMKQSNPGFDVQKKKKFKKLSLSNCILRNPRRKVLQIVKDCNNLDKNGTNNNLRYPEKIVKLVNRVDDLNTNTKKTRNKVPARKKVFRNYKVPHESAEVKKVGDTNKTTKHKTAETANPTMSCQKDYDEDAVIDHCKEVKDSVTQTGYKKKIRKKTSYSLTDPGCKDNSKQQENDGECSPAGVIETPQNKAGLAEIGADQTIVSEGLSVAAIDTALGETEANLPSNSCNTIIRDLLESMKDRSKPEAVQALCQLLVSLCSNLKEDGNVMKRSLEIVLKEFNSKEENQSKLITEPHSIDFSNDVKALGDNSNVERETIDNFGSKNTVGSSGDNVINSTKYSEGNAEKEVGVEFTKAAVPCLGKQNKVCPENTVGQEAEDILNEVINNDCSSRIKNYDSNRKKVAKKQIKNTRGESTPENIISNDQKKSAERKSTKKGTRELDSIHKALNSLPQYSDIMRSGGPRKCRMKNNCGNGFEGNYTANLKKRRSVRKRTPPKAIDLICDDSLNTSVFPSSNNSFMENVTQVDNCGSEVVLTPKRASDTVSCSDISSVVNQEINNEDTHEDSSYCEIVNVFSTEEEENYSSIEISNKKIKEENDCVNIAKDLLAGFEEDLTDKSHPSVIKHTEEFFLGKKLLNR